MTKTEGPALPVFDEDLALRTILEGTATATGEPFFLALVENLALVLRTSGAWVTEYFEERRRLRALAFWVDGKWIEDFEYDIAGTLCEQAIEKHDLVFYPDRVIEITSHDFYGAVSYLGMPLLDVDGRILGHLAVIDTRPMPEEPRVQTVFRIFAARAGAELQRLRAEKEVRQGRDKLTRLIASAMDAILELDHDLHVTHINPAAEKLFKCAEAQLVGQDFRKFLSADGGEKLQNLIKALEKMPEDQRYLWIPGGLKAMCAGGGAFPAEATLSRFEVGRETFYTLILRNLNDRLEAEQKIRSLMVETEILREEVKTLRHSDAIIGESSVLQKVLRQVEQVAETHASVLILGETGTGKEAIARAIHAASRRRDKPLIKVNCAAIPATLIESEFFGHAKGAFTGAVSKREGRFALADGGTIFLDEIGELPIDLQVKLLRVLQEGEFEPVGSSETCRVDVRVIAATNRNLLEAIREGKFREDLYYRLNVFPIDLPPLRERGDDLILLANFFAQKVAQSMGRIIAPLSPEAGQRLKAYPWPGNVRELQNVIERAVITAHGDQLNFDSMFPESTQRSLAVSASSQATESERFLTLREMQELERSNLVLALKAAGGRVSGKRGAAALLGMNPSTLASRLRTLGIKRG